MSLTNHRINISILFFVLFILFGVSLASAIITDNSYIVACNFNNLSGTGSLNLSCTNSTIFTNNNTATATTGIIQNATNLVRASSQFVESTTPYFPNTNGSYTISAWVKPASVPAAGAGSCFTTAAVYNIARISNQTGLGPNNNPVMQMMCINSLGLRGEKYIQNVNTYGVSATVLFPTTQFTHVAYTYNYTSGNQTLYVNGTYVASVVIAVQGAGSGGSVQRGLTIGATDGNGYFNGVIDSVIVWNETKTPSDLLSIYNAGTGLEPPFSGAAIITNFSITSKDFYTNTPLTYLNVSFNGTVYASTNGTVYLPILSNATFLINFTVNASDNGGFRNQSYVNVNATSGSWLANLSQSTTSFYAVEKISNTTLTGTNFTTAFVNNLTHYMNISAFAVTVNKSGYFNKIVSYTPVLFSNTSQNISYMTATKLNITVRDAFNNSAINSFTIMLNNSAYSYSENQSTTNGTVFADFINGSINITFDGSASSYAVMDFNYTLVTGMNNITLYVYQTNSIGFTFKDEITKQVINTVNITIALIGSYASYNTTTGNGTAFISLITPDTYTIRYNASNYYTTRFYTFKLTNTSTNNITLYMLNSSLGTNITVTVIDLSNGGRVVESAYVFVQKYDLATNSYITREILTTNFEGQAVFDAQLSVEYYKFVVQYPFGTVVQTTTPSYLYSNTLTIPIQTASAATTIYNTVLGISGNVSYNPSTNNFRFIYVDPTNSITQGCLNVYRIYGNYTKTLYNTTCVVSTSATILSQIVNLSSGEYQAEGVVLLAGKYYLIDSNSYVFNSSATWGQLGLLLNGLFTILIIFMFKNPIASLIVLPLPTLFFTAIGLVIWPMWIPASILVMSWIAAGMISRWA